MTVRDLVVRRMSRAVPSIMVALVAAVGVTGLAALATLFGEWVTPSRTSARELAGATLFVIGGYVFSVAAMRTGELSFVAPFRYTSLLVALILGAAIFGEFPAPLTLIGAAIVVATGLFTLYREQRRGTPGCRGRRTPRPPTRPRTAWASGSGSGSNWPDRLPRPSCIRSRAGRSAG